ncbi:hypothetical protein [Phycicoccus sp. DTK01]|uniref:hypothetical protein n=1 Tax=Phycicoccus sp. DTK01 TaxID=2785745 RepID=UPI001A8DBBDF|nr:hypothetical protein [Phycicoccus sp. DTK01]GIL36557.1 hypothetical protein PDTK01_26320 [Phycicoccus sp. DTK01]
MSSAPFPQPPSPQPVHPHLAGPDPMAPPVAPAHASTGGGAAVGWAVGAAVASGVAVVLSVVALLLAGSGFFAGAVDDGGGWAESVRGQVTALPDGAALSGDRLEWAVGAAESDFGWTIDDLSCPDTPAVTTSTVVVCTGTYEDADWTGAVLFEDSVGGFVVAEF